MSSGRYGVHSHWGAEHRNFEGKQSCGGWAVDRGRVVLLVPEEAVVSAGADDETSGFVRRTLGPLIGHDERHQGDLLRTLEAYLAAGRQPAVTAAELHIQPNTLYQRLKRIASVLDLDWDDADSVLQVHVAVRLRRLIGALAPVPRAGKPR